MIHNYSKVNISNLLINPEFDYKTEGKNVSLSKEGVNISLRDINTIRNISGIDPIKDLYEENYSLCSQLNIKKPENY